MLLGESVDRAPWRLVARCVELERGRVRPPFPVPVQKRTRWSPLPDLYCTSIGQAADEVEHMEAFDADYRETNGGFGHVRC